MTHKELVDILSTDFYENFAQTTALAIINSESVDSLYDLAIGRAVDFDKDRAKKVIFRAAYALEYIYFNHASYFEPYRSRFFNDFASTQNGSAKRHFTKMMAHALRESLPDNVTCDHIAEACAQWVVEPRVRVAVQIWALEVLFELRHNVEWLGDLIPEIIEPLSRNPSPAMLVRIRRWRDVKFY